MIYAVKIPISEIDAYVAVGFDDDAELVNQYHILGGSLDACIENTVKTIKETHNDFFKLAAYKVMYGKKPIGYFALSKEHKILYSFAINKAYRNGPILTALFNTIVIMMSSFNCYLYNKNTRAIDFLVKNGMFKELDNSGYTVLSYKKGEM